MSKIEITKNNIIKDDQERLSQSEIDHMLAEAERYREDNAVMKQSDGLSPMDWPKYMSLRIKEIS